MAAYSLDLRERIIRAVEGGEQTKRAVAALFDVPESFILSSYGSAVKWVIWHPYRTAAVTRPSCRKNNSRTLRKLNRALAKALETIAPEDIVGWFIHCGYVYSFE